MAFENTMLGSGSYLVCTNCGGPVSNPIIALNDDEVYCDECLRNLHAKRSASNFQMLEFDISTYGQLDFGIDTTATH